jgi:hypothetical protein
MNILIDEIDFIEISEFTDEYVYDLEVDDETHTFIGNDILVHNSAYVQFKPLLDTIVSPISDPLKFIIRLYNVFLGSWIKNIFDDYSKEYGLENIQDLEMETISYDMLILKKKKYVLNKAWKASAGDGIFYQRLSKIEPKGVELVQSSTPLFVRKCLKEILLIIFEIGNSCDYKDLILYLKESKSKFALSDINDISLGSSLTDYEKFILDDRKRFIIGDNCPIHVRAAGVYNFNLNNSKWGKKYQRIKSGDKLKYYYAVQNKDNQNVFGYLPGNYPIEFAPPIDIETQFLKCIIDPVNRFLTAMKLPIINNSLITKKSLF